MVKRWLIRGVFMLPILLCAGGWVESYGHWDQLSYQGSRGGAFSSVGGVVSVGYIAIDAQSSGWQFSRASLPPISRRILDRRNGLFLGFAYGHSAAVDYEAYWAYIPYYFPLLLFSGVLLIVWRKTRARQAGGAFPVDMKTKR